MKRRVIINLSAVAVAVVALLMLAGWVGAWQLAQPRPSDSGTLALAGAPTVVSYQGQVKVNGSPYNGTGYFKFAVVDSAGSTSFWSNDGTSTAGSQPANAVELTVASGLFNVLLGDTSLTGMTETLSADVFSGTDRYLRAWFSSDNVTFQQLSPDRRIAAVPYALQAEEAANAHTLDGQEASDLAVPSGAMVLGLPNDTRLTGAGYTDLGATNVTYESWRSITTTNAPSGRYVQTAVWTGSEMLIWGGWSAGLLNTGGRYDPSTDAWTPITSTNAPTGRDYHTAVWTGGEMLVWGGFDGDNANTGGRYNPATDAWTPTTTTNAPSGRYLHTAVWTGSEMIVWGGYGTSPSYKNDGGRYDPSTDTWTAITTSNAPSARRAHTAVWTGSEMLIWGGVGTGPTYKIDGGRYDPSTDTWTAMSSTNAPSPREMHTVVWTGSEMLVWGGWVGDGYKNDGGRYDPSTDTWKGITTTNAPSIRCSHTAVWTGSEMIIWGGEGSSPTYKNDGGRYDPSTDTWMAISSTNAPEARRYHTAVCSGSEMLVWGGYGSVAHLNCGGRYRYSPLLHVYQKP